MATDNTNRWAERSKAWARATPQGASQDDHFNQMIIAEAGIAPGETILDIAAGSGNPSVSIALSMAGDGMIVCTDLTPAMLETARGRADHLDLSILRFAAADMIALPFPDAVFDCVTCRFGIMFPEDKIAAACEALRVLKPGGRIAYVVWGPYDQNPAFFVPRRAVTAFFGESEGPAPDRHALSASGVLKDILDRGGFSRTEERDLKYRNEVPDSEAYVVNGLRRSFGYKIDALSAEEFDRLTQSVLEAWAPYIEEGQLRVPNFARMGIGWKAD